MKTESLTRILSAVAFVAMLSASSSVFAQVKIGTNPTTIGANSNLEVEATNNNKTVIQKDNGNVGVGQSTPTNKLHVTATTDPLKLEGVQTGTNGDVGLVITTDGVVKKAVPEATPLVRFLASISTSGQVWPTGSIQDVIFQRLDFETYPGSATISNTAAGSIKVPRDGYYQVTSNIHFYDVGAGGVQSFCVYYKKNNAGISGFEACQRFNGPNRPASSAVTVLKLVAGDVISAFLQNVGTQSQTVDGCNLQVFELR